MNHTRSHKCIFNVFVCVCVCVCVCVYVCVYMANIVFLTNQIADILYVSDKLLYVTLSFLPPPCFFKGVKIFQNEFYGGVPKQYIGLSKK